MNVAKNPLEISQQKENKIKDLIDFYKRHTNIPAVFIVSHLRTVKELTNSESKDISGTIFNIPNGIEIDVVKKVDDYYEEVRERIFWNGGDDVFMAAKKFTKDGMFVMPPNAKEIKGNGFSIGIMANSITNIRLIQYLLYVSFFYRDGEFLIHDNGAFKSPVQNITAKDKQSLFSTIDKLANSTDEYAYLLSLKETGVFAKSKDVINAMLDSENGKSNFIDFLKDAIDTNFVKTKETLLPFKEEKDLYVKAKKSNIIGFNKDTKSYQIKGTDGKFITDSTIIVTDEKETDVLDILILSELTKNEQIRNNLQLLLKGK